jgi:hypothetical protein
MDNRKRRSFPLIHRQTNPLRAVAVGFASGYPKASALGLSLVATKAGLQPLRYAFLDATRKPIQIFIRQSRSTSCYNPISIRRVRNLYRQICKIIPMCVARDENNTTLLTTSSHTNHHNFTTTSPQLSHNKASKTAGKCRPIQTKHPQSPNIHHNSPQNPKSIFIHNQKAQPPLLTSCTRRNTLHAPFQLK